MKGEEEMLGIMGKEVVNMVMGGVMGCMDEEKVLWVFKDNMKYDVNGRGKLVMGGGDGDRGLRGGKIIVDS